MSDEHASHHIIQPKVYVFNALAIVVLMLATVAFGKYPPLEFAGGSNGINFWIALGIAIAKMGCIMAFFMGVKYNTHLVKIFTVAAFLWVLVFFAFVMSDYVSPHADLGSPYSDIEVQGVYPLPK